jgi:oligoribonuclease NrnB/cAMP/cGMP phosphodiesterase (DHH superfamily)
MDGFASAAIVQLKYPDVKLIGINHGQPFRHDMIRKTDEIYMVDFCLEPADEMRKLANNCKTLYWIDHHVSQIDKMVEAKIKLPGLLSYDDDEKEAPEGTIAGSFAACELVWQYLFPDKEMPYGIYLLGRYDVWDLDVDPNVLKFQYGSRLQSVFVDKDSDFWKRLFASDKEFMDHIIAEGDVILRYERQINARLMRGYSYLKDFHGYRALVINRQYSSTLTFESVWDGDKHDIMVAYSRNPDCWLVSLYTAKKDIDVSAIARSYEHNGKRGGGHKKAAGFQTQDISPLLPA